MTRRSLAHRASIIVLLLVLAGVLSAPSALQAVARQNTVTVRISAADLAHLPQITPVSRTDYGAFSILEVTSQDLRALKAANIHARAEESGSRIRLQGREITVSSASQGTPAQSVEGLCLVQLPGPAKRDWTQRIEASGAKIVSYIPDNSFLVWVDPRAMNGLKQLGFLRWSSAYTGSLKVASSLKTATGSVFLSVTIYDDIDGKALQSIQALGAIVIRSDSSLSSSSAPLITAVVVCDASVIPKLAQLPRTVFIDRAQTQVKLDDEVACQIVAHNLDGSNIPLTSPTYRNWLNSLGYDGTGVNISIIDTGFDVNDNATCHADCRGRLTKIILYLGADSPDPSGHGTHVTGIAAGNGALGTTDSAGFLYGMGIAPAAGIVVQNAAATTGVFPPTGTTWETLTHDASRAGAIVANNSWSYSAYSNIGYSGNCSVFDRLVRDSDDYTTGPQPLGLVFSIGNTGPNLSTVGDPKEAKNIITVGASENYRPDNPLGAACGSSGNILGIASMSGRGPCLDGRLAPTLVAPGTAMASAESYFADYNGGGCKAQVLDQFGMDTGYAWMSGTSMAAPVVTGGAALITQRWRATHFGQNPSPAMLKAILVNGADDLYGGRDGRGGTVGHIPNNDQGWGRVDLANSVDPSDTFYEDQAHLLTESGQIYRYRVETVDPGKPLKITLTWTDAPGLPGANAWVNDLDLTADTGSDTYLGNVFSNGWSVTGGSRDYRNNIECIYIQNPSGIYTISVLAANIAGNAIPGNGLPLDQDFALVVKNGTVGGTTLDAYTPVSNANSPSPDHYAAVQQPGGWSAAALLPEQGGDNNVTLCTDAGYASAIQATSGANPLPKFIAVDGNRSVPLQLYPLVSRTSGNAGYALEWATSTADLAPGVADTRTFSTSNLVRTWDLPVAGPAACGLVVTPTSSDLDLGVAVFKSASNQPATYYQTLNQALFRDDPTGPGNTHKMILQMPSAGRYGVVVWKKGGSGSFSIQSDLTPPTPVLITPTLAYTSDLSTLGASWTSTDPESGIAKYEYAIGTTAGATDIVGWTDVGTATSVQRTDITLSLDTSYYFTVRATNGFGMQTTGTSTPTIAVATIPSIAAVKALTDNHYVQLTARNVSAVYSGKFYIEDPDRASGIGVLWDGTVQEGARVTVIGKIITGPYWERLIQAAQVTTN